MKDVKFLSVEIVIFGEVEPTLINVGGITLSRKGREFIVDPVKAEFIKGYDETTLDIEIEIDKKMFPECKFDLAKEDLLASDLKGKVLFNTEKNKNNICYKAKKKTLFVEVDNKEIAIDLELEENNGK